MAEEEEEKKIKEFPLYEGKDPSEWESGGGNKYKNYLLGGYKKEGKQLTGVQESDLDRLKEYEKRKGKSDESEESAMVDVSSLDWGKLKNPITIGFYESFPRWFFWESFHKNMKNFVDRERKTKTKLQISREAQEKYDKIQGKKEQDSKENSGAQSQQEQTPKRKKGIWVRFVDYCKRSNNKALGIESSGNARVLGSENARQNAAKLDKTEGIINNKMQDEINELGEE